MSGHDGSGLARLLLAPMRSVERATVRDVDHVDPPSRAVTAPSPSFSGLPLPPGAKFVDHPSLGHNDAYITPGSHSYRDLNGVVHTQVDKLVLYKGVGPKGASALKDKHQRPTGSVGLGSDKSDWQGSYFHDDPAHAKNYADEYNEDFDPTKRFEIGPDGAIKTNHSHLGGSVLRYEHGPTEVLTPGMQLHGLTADQIAGDKQTLGLDPHSTKPLMDQLGDHNQVLHNPLPVHSSNGSDPPSEWIVPWNSVGGAGLHEVESIAPGNR